MSRPLPEPVTPFGMTYKAHLQDALKWLDTRRERLHHEGCSVHAPSAQCNCGLHKTLTNVRAVVNAMDAQLPAVINCRNCAHLGEFKTRCYSPQKCVNGDRYEALPPVRLWRTT